MLLQVPSEEDDDDNLRTPKHRMLKQHVVCRVIKFVSPPNLDEKSAFVGKSVHLSQTASSERRSLCKATGRRTGSFQALPPAANIKWNISFISNNNPPKKEKKVLIKK